VTVSASSLAFDTVPDLDATMDIQIPALAWQPAGPGRWERTYYPHGEPVVVQVEREGQRLAFSYQVDPDTARELDEMLAVAFPADKQIDKLALDGHPVLTALRRRYGGVIVMTAPPFEALVLTVLSQNRSGDTVRQVFPKLAAACGGITAERIAALPVDQLADLIRSAGPYKAARLSQTAATIATLGEAAFEQIVRQPAPQALEYLEALPGVAHKTAACVLVFAGATTGTLPVDTHLFRVVDRLGLATHEGRNSKSVATKLISTLLEYGPDLAPAHFVFLLVGRTTCVAGTPNCTACFLAEECGYAIRLEEAAR
jgi:endonuclease III